MKQNTLLIVTATVLLTGLAAVLLSKSLASSESAAGAPEDSRSGLSEPRTRASSRTGTKSTARYSDMLSTMQPNRFSKDKLAADLQGLSLSEIPEMLDVLAAKAGLGGLGKEDEALLEGILGWWSLEDQDAAVGWVLAIKNPESRSELLGVMLRSISGENFEDAVVLLETLRNRHGETPKIPVGLFEKSAEQGAETLLRVCRAGLYETGSTGGYELKYPAGFDFETALNQLGESQANAADGERLSFVPSNLATEWMKRDPQAALDWAMSGKDVMFNSEVSDLIAAYREVGSDADVVGLVADLYVARGSYGEVWNTLTKIGSDSITREFLAQAPRNVGQDVHIKGLLQASMSGSFSEEAAMRAMLLGTLDAQGRHDLFTGDQAIKMPFAAAREQVRAELLRLEHTPEEVSRMIGDK